MIQKFQPTKQQQQHNLNTFAAPLKYKWLTEQEKLRITLQLGHIYLITSKTHFTAVLREACSS